MRGLSWPASLVVAVAISGCGHDELDAKDGIAADLAKVKHDPKPERTTSAVERLDSLRAGHKASGPISK